MTSPAMPPTRHPDSPRPFPRSPLSGRAGQVLGAAVLLLVAGLLVLLAACEAPRLSVDVIPPETTVSARTPAASVTAPRFTALPTSSPRATLCAHGRVAGKVCRPGVDVYLRTCCPDWEAVTTSGAGGAFAFEGLTAGTFTITAGLQSRQVILKGCYSQVNVDFCPEPTVGPGQW